VGAECRKEKGKRSCGECIQRKKRCKKVGEEKEKWKVQKGKGKGKEKEQWAEEEELEWEAVPSEEDDVLLCSFLQVLFEGEVIS
jgi:hypothetical protein